MKPTIHIGQGVRFGENVVLRGTLNIGNFSSIWHNVILRGDVSPIVIGSNCNIQDNTVLHGQLNQWDVILGDRVSIGHSCILHGCELADDSFIGMGSIVMNGAYIGPYVLVAAGSLIAEGSRFAERETLVMGRPAKTVRKLKPKELQMIEQTPKRYMDYAKKWLPVSIS